MFEHLESRTHFDVTTIAHRGGFAPGVDDFPLPAVAGATSVDVTADFRMQMIAAADTSSAPTLLNPIEVRFDNLATLAGPGVFVDFYAASPPVTVMTFTLAQQSEGQTTGGAAVLHITDPATVAALSGGATLTFSSASAVTVSPPQAAPYVVTFVTTTEDLTVRFNDASLIEPPPPPPPPPPPATNEPPGNHVGWLKGKGNPHRDLSELLA